MRVDEAHLPRGLDASPMVWMSFGISDIFLRNHSTGAGPMPADRQYFFGEFRLDAKQRALFRNAAFVPVAPKLLDTLIFLVERSGQIVEKRELIDAVWHGVIVEEVGLARNVSDLRKLLSAGDEDRAYIETVPKRGYRFVADVRDQPAPEFARGPAAVERAESSTERPRQDPAVQPPAVPNPAAESARVPAASATAPRTWARTSIGVLTLGILAALGAFLYWQGSSREARGSRRPMLVVLPVQNLTGDPNREYISDGMTEELIARLGSLDPDRLGVIARTSSMTYKATSKDIARIGRELGVQYVLESSLRANAQRIRFTAQLVRASDQSHIWASDYDRNSEDLLALEDEIGQTVAKEIDYRLTSQSPNSELHRRAVSSESHEAYLLGRYYSNQGDEPSLRRGIDLFHEALQKDPSNALAYAGLADAYNGLSDWYLPPRSVMPEAKQAALDALRIDDTQSAAHNALCATLTVYDWNWSGAERECRRAIELNPNSSDAHDSYAMLLAYIGRTAEAAAEMRRAEELDPLSFRILCDGAFLEFLARNYALAEKRAKRSIDLAPDYFLVRSYLSIVYVQMQRYDEAVAEAEKAVQLTSSPLARGFLAYVYAAAGRTADARRISGELKRQRAHSYVCAFEIGTTELALGNAEEALRWIETAYDDRSLCISSMKFDPRLDSIRTLPSYRDLVRRVGFP